MRATFGLLLFPCLAACSILPHDGPGAHSFPKSPARSEARAVQRYATVDLDFETTQQIAAHPPQALLGLRESSSDARNDLIAEGDVLTVSVFEAGTSGLFARPSEMAGGDTAQTLPRAVVDQSGTLSVPFAGRVRVAGLSPAEAADAIRSALTGRAVDPQVTVTLIESRANSVSVIGAVRTAGRFPISAHNDRLLDALASAGGPTRAPGDLTVVVSRGDRSATAPLDLVLSSPDQNIRLAPHDQVRVLDQPRKYITFGAFLRDSQTPIEDQSVNLAEAISRAGGLDTNSANAASVVVFRFERPEVARALGVNLPPTSKGVPIVYRLNLRRPEGVFVADNFIIRANDIIYVPRSDITEAQKFFQLLDSITQLTYNVTTTSTIP